MINCVINYEVTGAAGVKDGVVSVFSTRTVKVGGGECSCMKGGPEDGFAFAIRTLMDYSIVDIKVADVFGNAWPMVHTNKRERIVAGIARVVTHPLTSWMISILLLGLCGGMSHPCWVSGAVEESRWGVINRLFIPFFHVWVNDVSENGDVVEV